MRMLVADDETFECCEKTYPVQESQNVKNDEEGEDTEINLSQEFRLGRVRWTRQD